SWSGLFYFNTRSAEDHNPPGYAAREHHPRYPSQGRGYKHLRHHPAQARPHDRMRRPPQRTRHHYHTTTIRPHTHLLRTPHTHHHRTNDRNPTRLHTRNQ